MLWIDIEDIADELERKHPEADIITLRFTTLHQWVCEVNEFDDDPNKSNEKILEAIQAKWLELREE